MKRRIVFALAGLLLATGSAWATPVGLELVLLVDVSGSVDSTEYNLQKQGYVDAFHNAAVQSTILGSVDHAIAVTYVEWSSDNQHIQKVGWTLIDSVASADAFANAISATSRTFNNSTAIQSAMLYGSGLFNNAFESPRQVIDVSGDGSDNDTTSCNRIANPACGRDAALLAGVDAINGLAILGSEANLLAYYQNNVAGGPGSFVMPANGFADFGDAIEKKLEREINTVPEPGTLLLLGGGLTGFVLRRRRRA